jgi:hypothetical protein
MKMIFPRGCALAAVLLLLAGSIHPLKGQGSGIAFGVFLQASLEKVQQIIREAQEAGRSVVISAGVQAQATITQAQVAYEASLNKSIDALNAQERKAYTDIDNLVKQLAQQTNEAANNALGQAQTIVNELPLSKKYPQIRTYEPLFAVAGIKDFSVAMKGNFPFAFDAKTIPWIEMNGKRYNAISYNTSALGFNVPVADFGNADEHALRRVAATVKVPWDASKWYHLIRSTKIAQYGFEFAELPRKPGTVTVTHTLPTSSPTATPFASQVWRYDSSRDDMEATQCWSVPEAEQREGWRIKPDSCRMEIVREEEGAKNHDWWDMGQKDTSDIQVCWRARTEHHGGINRHSGKIQWRIAGTLIRTVPGTTDQGDTFIPNWGESKLLQYTAGTWKVHFVRFDGRIDDFNTTEIMNPFLHVEATGDSLKISTYPFQ